MPSSIYKQPCMLFRRRYPDLSLSSTIPPRPTGTGEEGPGSQTETMLNPLWLGLELVMTGTSAEVPLPPDHETRSPIHPIGAALNRYVDNMKCEKELAKYFIAITPC
ncbi:unnamed protein product [Brassica napus]|uniref:(rape) hypothetical protein n=1 Tax=Brassica napus TaxID=3708 RepID=A0A816XB59_BRANA|nr:unnamed protein product [Brassica napus]